MLFKRVDPSAISGIPSTLCYQLLGKSRRPKIKQFINLNWNLVWLNRAKFDPHTLLCNFKPPGQPVVGRFPLSRIVSSKFNICSYILLQTPYRPSTTWYGKTRKTRHPSWRLHLTHKPAAATHHHLHTRFSSLFLHHRPENPSSTTRIMRVIPSQFNYFIIKVMIWCIILN